MYFRRVTLGMIAVAAMLLLSRGASAELVGLWRFDSDVSPQPDASGNGHVGALEGDVMWVNDADRGSGVMEFDGDTDYLAVEDTDKLSLTGDMTMAAWVNIVDYDAWRSVMGKTGIAPSNNHPAPYDFYIVQQNGILRAYFGNGNTLDGSAYADSLDIVEPETWTHVAVTVTEDGEVMQYFNGEDTTNQTDVSGTIREDLDEELRIGGRGDDVTNMYGRMDDVALFDEVLTQEQIKTIMDGDFGEWGVGGGVARLEAGDANMDLKFDQLDLVQVQIAAKYITGQAATWGEGDWNAAPGGSWAVRRRVTGCSTNWTSSRP